MPRKLRTFVTTSGFFELAVAAPSMKAALEIWGAGPDLFRRGYADETDDSAIVKATMAKPGVVLQRGVGSKGSFTEHARLPDLSALDMEKKKDCPSGPVSKSPPAPQAVDRTSEVKAAKLFERAQEQRKKAKSQAEADAVKARKRLADEIRKAEAALESAQREHDKRITAIEQRIAEFEGKAREEDERWRREKESLEGAIRKRRG